VVGDWILDEDENYISISGCNTMLEKQKKTRWHELYRDEIPAEPSYMGYALISLRIAWLFATYICNAHTLTKGICTYQEMVLLYSPNLGAIED